MKEHRVYHIHVAGNLDLKQGYIGVTTNLKQRIRSHKHSGMLRIDDIVTVLCIGTRNYCYALERLLRPFNNIGRNISHGGCVNSTCIKIGQHLSKSTEVKPGQRLGVDTEFKKGVTPHNKGGGKDYIFTDPTGREHLVLCISDFCKVHSLTPQNMRKVAKGERRFHKGWKASVLTGR